MNASAITKQKPKQSKCIISPPPPPSCVNHVRMDLARSGSPDARVMQRQWWVWTRTDSNKALGHWLTTRKSRVSKSVSCYPCFISLARVRINDGGSRGVWLNEVASSNGGNSCSLPPSWIMIPAENRRRFLLSQRSTVRRRHVVSSFSIFFCMFSMLDPMILIICRIMWRIIGCRDTCVKELLCNASVRR